MGYIYIWTDKRNRMPYVGKTTKTYAHRLAQHLLSKDFFSKE